MKKYIMALDQGTTSSRCIIFDKYGKQISLSQREFKQHYLKNGWVEHNPHDILNTQIDTAIVAINQADIRPAEIASIGITNQRETTIIWDRKTGEPVYNAIVWQCRRTADYCETLREKGFSEIIKNKTGLLPDPYFSATKIMWILDNVDGVRARAERGELAFGTIDSYLIWNLTGGAVHATDYTNASRTMLFNINTLQWDEELLTMFNIPKALLPEVRDSSGFFGKTNCFGSEIDITGVAGDQHSALFGQCCFESGSGKNTYGTGCFLLMNTGDKPVISKNGLLTTIAWSIDGKITYALEGSVFVAGAAIQWLRDEMGLLATAAQSEEIALSVENTNGVYVVPAFTGLGAPYWNPHARGIITGLTRSTNKAHIIRATLEALAFQSFDVIKAMEADSCIKAKTLKVDGGASENNFLMQFQADILGEIVERSETIETTALGAAFLAGLAVGFWSSMDELKAINFSQKRFYPNFDVEKRNDLLCEWHNAVSMINPRHK